MGLMLKNDVLFVFIMKMEISFGDIKWLTLNEKCCIQHTNMYAFKDVMYICVCVNVNAKFGECAFERECP